MTPEPTSSYSKKAIIWPAPVKSGDRLAVVAPASPVAPDLFAAGAAWLEKWGFRLSHGPEIFMPRPFQGDADLQACQFLKQSLLDTEVKGIICARGGYGTLRILEHLDYSLLAARPRYFIGFSDITNLLCRFTQQAGVVTFHGPTVAHLGEISSRARDHFFRVLTRPEPSCVCFRDLQVLAPGYACGPLIGGNLTTICHLLGTPFALSLTGQVLFLEDHNEAPYRLDRLLQHLRLSGSLSGLKAMVLGSFTCCGKQQQVWELFAEMGKSLGIPVLAGLPAGHQPDNFILPLGAEMVVDGPNRTASLRDHV
ncbi:MAG: LD-carboxypeptidase [Deltaproteobacteria bacterium]|nr:LD-carboxypeptidase [Deltaproteobacteria bacterium]